MAGRAAYQGDGFGLVDDKGRVAIPASLRNILALNSPRDDGKDGGTVIVGVHQKHPCLIAYDPGYVPVLKGQLDAREAAHPAADGEYDYNIKRRAAHGEAVPFDGSGRCILPPFPRFHAGIGTNAFFFGVFDYLEIWDPATLIGTDGVPEMMKACARFHCAQKGVAL